MLPYGMLCQEVAALWVGGKRRDGHKRRGGSVARRQAVEAAAAGSRGRRVRMPAGACKCCEMLCVLHASECANGEQVAEIRNDQVYNERRSRQRALRRIEIPRSVLTIRSAPAVVVRQRQSFNRSYTVCRGATQLSLRLPRVHVITFFHEPNATLRPHRRRTRYARFTVPVVRER